MYRYQRLHVYCIWVQKYKAIKPIFGAVRFFPV